MSTGLTQSASLAASPSPPLPKVVSGWEVASQNLICYGADFFSSWTSIAVSLLFSHPIDTLRIRRQTHLYTLRQTISSHGIHSLYHGVATPLVTTGPSIANAFALNDLFKRLVAYLRYGDADCKKRLNLPELALSGALAGSTSSVFQCPIAVIRVQQQVAAHSHEPAATSNSGTGTGGAKRVVRVPGFFEMGRSVYAHYGVRGLYRGLPNEAVQCGLGRLVYFSVYEEGKRVLNPILPGHPVAAQILSAVAASWCGWVVVYPLDVVKNRVQGDRIGHIEDGARRYRGLIHCAQVTYKELGFKGMWIGLPTTLARGVVSSGISLPGYEFVRPYLRTAFGVHIGDDAGASKK